ncbi:transcriptional activator chrR [Asticcacaulis biprosthecium C19]|uniref:Transcriptional activator chrR n=1 Tax=Asticcacaulis biprosthecium C19 TaxID=715226 RepID=F4QKF4_9CAUL|nr:ChrR family anti-sigma-E factor [Asticcacaulis biprosthecium]EGF92106.1 transcriptional activator chrR [Asticcacaulis biprosthecium C19]
MSSPNHHPGDDLLWDYHRGALAPGLALAVRTHAETCAHCRSDFKLFDAMGGAMLEEMEGVAMSDNALDLALARIERPETDEVVAPPHLPAFLEGFELPESLKSVKIKDRYWAAPGVWMAPIVLEGAPKAQKTYLMSVRSGLQMPEHTHRGREITVMLRGRFRDHKGSYGPGDFAMCDESDQRHTPAMEGDDDCLCLVFQEGPIVPQSFVAWMLQPFAGI